MSGIVSASGVSLVLLCSEEDDLELVELVHRARSHGMIPQVIAGIEQDDRPLLAAIADPDNARALFVVLRSDFLSAERMREIKATFGRARARQQELLAVRLDPGRTDAVLSTLVARAQPPRAPTKRAVRPEMSAVTALVERSGVLRLLPVGESTPPDAIAAVPLDPDAFAIAEAELDLGIDVDEPPPPPPHVSVEPGTPERVGVRPTSELDTIMDGPTDVTVPGTIMAEPVRARRQSRWGLALAGGLVLAMGGGAAAWMSMQPRTTEASAPATAEPESDASPKRSRVTVPEPAPRAVRTDPVEPAPVPADPAAVDEAVGDPAAPAAEDEAEGEDDERPRARGRKRAGKSDKKEAEPVAQGEPGEPAAPAAEPAPLEPAPLETDPPASGAP